MNMRPDQKNTQLARSTTIRQQLWAGMFACFLACLILTSCSNPNEKANEAYVESVTLLKEAEQSLVAYRSGSSENPEDFVRKFTKAMENMNRITTKYSRSDLAVKLIQGETKLNGQQLSAYQLRVKQIIEAYQDAIAARGQAMKSSAKSPGNFALAMVTLTGQPYRTEENTYKNVATLLAKAGEYAEALRFVDDKIKNGSSQFDNQNHAAPIPMSCLIEVNGEVAIEMLKRGATKDALQLLQQIQLSAAFINQRDDKALEKLDQTLESFAEQMAKQAEFDEAIVIAQRIVNESIRGWALQDIAKASPSLGQMKVLQSIALKIKEPLPQCRALTAIFATSVTNVTDGSQGLSEQLFNDALTSGRSETNVNLRCCALNELAQTLIKAKRNPVDVINESLLAAGMLTDEEWMPWKSIQVRNIAETIAMSGNVDRAVELVSKIEATQRRVGLTRIADQCAKLGMKERAIQVAELILNEPLAPVDSPAFFSQAGTLARAAELLSSFGQQQRGRAGLEGAVKKWGSIIFAESAKGTNRNISSLEGELAEILAQLAVLGNLEVALDSAAKLKYHDTFESIAVALASAGKVDDAVAVVHRSIQKENAFYNVARELAEHGHGLEALQLMKDLLKSQSDSDQRLNPMFVWMMVNVLGSFPSGTFSADECKMAASIIQYANLPLRRDWCFPFVE